MINWNNQCFLISTDGTPGNYVNNNFDSYFLEETVVVLLNFWLSEDFILAIVRNELPLPRA